MSTVTARDQALIEDVTPDTARRPWIAVTAVIVVTTVLCAVSGFLFGTVQGDIPWPATQAEETVYYTARGLNWGAIAFAVVGTLAVAVIPWRPAPADRWLVAAVTLVGSGFLGMIVFFIAYAIGQENFLFAFTS